MFNCQFYPKAKISYAQVIIKLSIVLQEMCQFCSKNIRYSCILTLKDDERYYNKLENFLLRAKRMKN